jgi:hypothetical protein
MDNLSNLTRFIINCEKSNTNWCEGSSINGVMIFGTMFDPLPRPHRHVLASQYCDVIYVRLLTIKAVTETFIFRELEHIKSVQRIANLKNHSTVPYSCIGLPPPGSRLPPPPPPINLKTSKIVDPLISRPLIIMCSCVHYCSL